jgi:hypothetical protein
MVGAAGRIQGRGANAHKICGYWHGGGRNTGVVVEAGLRWLGHQPGTPSTGRGQRACPPGVGARVIGQPLVHRLLCFYSGLARIDVGGGRFSRGNQLFQQGVAKQHQASLAPQGRSGAEQRRHQSLAASACHSASGACSSGVLVERRSARRARATHGLHAGLGRSARLQLVEAALGGGKVHPAQAVEEVVQAVAGRHTCRSWR